MLYKPLLIVIFCSSILVIPSLEYSRSMLYKVDEYTERYWNGHEWVYILYPLQIESAEALSVIINNCNNPSIDECNDVYVRNDSGSGRVSSTAADMRVGDDNYKSEYRSFVKFPISLLYGKTQFGRIEASHTEIPSTVLNIILHRSTIQG